MKASIKCLGLKLVLLILVPFIGSGLLIKIFPMRFLDEEYALYRENKDYAKGHNQYSRVLILGDSVAKADWLPTLLSEDTYNYALGGASTAEEYYYLKDYLEHNDLPDYIIYTIGSSHLLEMSTLWTRSVYFHRMDRDDLNDLINTSNRFPDDTELIELSEQGKYIFMYYFYSPTKYGTALGNGLFSSSRYHYNINKYQEVLQNKGQIQFGTLEYCDEYNSCVEYSGFEVSEMLDYYLQETIRLCEENNIKFIFQNPPINEASYNALNEKFVRDYEEYLCNLQELYPDAIIDTKLFSYGNEYFGDSTHLNSKGTEKFTLEMKEKYAYIFEEDQ
jgi:hypothetical protein